MARVERAAPMLAVAGSKRAALFTAARDKNDRLAAILVSTDVNRRDIVTIERPEVRASGWRITYRR